MTMNEKCHIPSCGNTSDGLYVANEQRQEDRKPVCSDACAGWLIGYARVIGHTYIVIDER